MLTLLRLDIHQEGRELTAESERNFGNVETKISQCGNFGFFDQVKVNGGVL